MCLTSRTAVTAVMASVVKFVQSWALWGVAMRTDGEIFKMFQFELNFLEDGGYRHSPRTP